MSKPLFSKKLRILLTCIPLFGLSSTLISNFPIRFAEKEDLHYSTGVFRIVDTASAANHVRLKSEDNKGQDMVFSCSYTPFGNGEQSSCGSEKNLAPYEGQKVTIGWYFIDKFLGFKNDMPQLVTIEMDDQIKRSYAHTQKKVRDSKNGLLYFIGPWFLIIILGCYWFTGKVR